MTTNIKPNPYTEARLIRDHNILISASAGAGKTTNLIERLMLRIQEDKIPVTQIIALTFANDAASELREKLEKKLTEAYEVTQDTFLYEQLSLLPQAQITTIHAFCLDMVRHYSYVLGIDPACADHIVDETLKSEMMDEAFKAALNDYPKNQQANLEALFAHFSSRPEMTDELRDNVYLLAAKLKTLNQPEKWIEQSIQALEATCFSDLTDDLKQWLVTYYRWQVDNLLNTAESNLLFISAQTGYYESFNDKPKQQQAVDLIMTGLTELIKELKQIEQWMSNFDYSIFRNRIVDLPKNGFNSIPDATNNHDIDKVMKKLPDLYKKLIAGLFEETDWFEDHSELKSRSIVLVELTQLYMDRYQALKEKKKVIDFDDMEHFALAILRNTSFDVALDYQKKYVDILVDEYQDTNFIQDAIITMIAREDNVFRVGDVKQSIYRFRNAQPELMAGRKKVQDDQNVVLYYDKNFRSAEPIVTFNNLLFSRLMNQNQLKASYDQMDWVSIGSLTQLPKEGDGVEFHLLIDNEKSDEPEEHDEIFEEDENKEEEPADFSNEEETDNGLQEQIIDLHPEDLNGAQSKAIYIANLIQDMRKRTEFKKYSDYTILVRTNAIKAILKDVFDQANIPNNISVKTGFFSSDAVQDVLLVVKFIIDPFNSINFIGLCLSDFVQMTEEHVAQLKLYKKRDQFYEALETAYPKKYELLRSFRENVANKNLVEIFRAIYGLNNYYDEYCNKQQRANLDLLFEKAQTFAQDNLTLAEFLLLIKNIKDEESSEAIPFTKRDDVVKVMTIHQSKGLQFPVVIFWSADKAPTKDKTGSVLLDSALGFALKTVKLPKRLSRKSPVRVSMDMKATQDDVEEQIRLLYVALTRAERRLIIVDQKPKAHYPALNYTSILNSLGPTNWILLALKPNEGYKHIEVAAPLTLTQINPPIVEPQTLMITEKPKTSIEFKTPSSKQSKFTHFKLNFDQNIGSDHGTLIHELFEKLPQTKVTEAMVKQNHPDISQNDLDAVMAFYKNDIYTLASSGVIKHEFPFIALINQEVLHGYMDFVAITEKDVILVDFKTDRVDQEATLLDLYTDQINDYRRVLMEMYPTHSVKVYLYSMALKAYILIN